MIPEPWLNSGFVGHDGDVSQLDDDISGSTGHSRGLVKIGHIRMDFEIL